MHIAIISEHASPVCVLGGKDAGGQNVYVAQLAKLLSQFGHTVEVFTRRDSDDLPIIEDVIEGFRLVRVPAGPPEFVEKERLLPYMKEFTDFTLRYMKNRRYEFDVIHSNFWMSGLVAADLKKALNIPFVITFHALGKVRRIHQGDQDRFSDERFRVEERIVEEADGIIAECPQDLLDLLELYEADHKAIDIVPCGFDSKEIYPLNKSYARRALGLNPNDEIVLHLGRMVPRKGADNVIRGFGRYVKDQKKKSQLIIVGGESDRPDPVLTPEIGRLMKIADDEGVAHLVTFLGSKDRQSLKVYYSAADVFVTTPWYEPFGITPIESMACGTPVIGSKVGGIKYTVKHEETGLLVPPNDPEALQGALTRMMSDKKLRQKWGAESLLRANRLFRWESMVLAIEKILLAKVNIQKRNVLFNYNREVLNVSSESNVR